MLKSVVRAHNEYALEGREGGREEARRQQPLLVCVAGRRKEEGGRKERGGEGAIGGRKDQTLRDTEKSLRYKVAATEWDVGRE